MVALGCGGPGVLRVPVRVAVDELMEDMCLGCGLSYRR